MSQATQHTLERYKPVPTVHLVMIYMIGFMTVFSMVMYGIVSPDRSELFKQSATLFVGALLGKFTNGFGTVSKPPQSNQKSNP